MDDQETRSELRQAAIHVRLARAALLLAVEDLRRSDEPVGDVAEGLASCATRLSEFADALKECADASEPD